MKNNPNRIGQVIGVETYKIRCIIDPNIMSFAPIVDGIPREIGRIGTLLKINLGTRRIYGVISGIQIEEIDIKSTVQKEKKLINVDLVGEYRPGEKFSWTIGQYPSVGDSIFILDDDDLSILYPISKEKGILRIGRNIKTGNLGQGQLQLDRFVLRHILISGMTGSGKSNFALALMNTIAKEYPNCQLIVIDPRGEYETGNDLFSILKPNVKGKDRFQIPHYYLPHELIGTLFFENCSETIKILIDRAVELWKQANSSDQKKIPYDLRKIWYDLSCLNKLTLNKPKAKSINDCFNRIDECLKEEGDYYTLTEPKYQAYEGNIVQGCDTYFNCFTLNLDNFLSKIQRLEYRILFDPEDYDKDMKKSTQWEEAIDIFKKWFQKPVTIFNFRDQSKELINIACLGFFNLILSQITESIIFPKQASFPRPILIIIEEAHEILGNRDICDIISLLIKQGRKHGIGFCFISQNPSSLPISILNQINTNCIFRLTSDIDRSLVQKMIPPSHFNLVPIIQTLPTGECVILGDAVDFPIHIQVPIQKEKTIGTDQKVTEIWQKERQNLDIFLKNKEDMEK